MSKYYKSSNCILKNIEDLGSNIDICTVEKINQKIFSIV